jgi:ParB-like chromosome segregation protein Spo0J
MRVHIVATELPLLSSEEYQALRDDIGKNGLLQPVLIDERGYIIDGRHRMRACEELGIEVRTELFTGTDAEKRARSNSLNCRRRHLTPSQQAHRVSADSTANHGSNQHKAKEDLQICRSSTARPITVPDASRLSGVSERLIAYGKFVRERGIKQLNDAVKNGKVVLHIAAKVAKLEPSEQKAFIANGFKLPSVPREPKPAAEVIVETAAAITVQPEEQKPTVTAAEKVQALLAEALEVMKAVDCSSEENKGISESVSLFTAAACSLCCDLKPIEAPPVPVKTKGVLFPEAVEERKIAGRMVPTDAEFEAFYSAFPRRVNKEKAKVAFAKAFKTLRKTLAPDAVIETIMQGVSVYAKHADPEVLCYPTTWLNGCRWEDDPGSIGKKAAVKSNAEYGKFRRKTDEEYNSF